MITAVLQFVALGPSFHSLVVTTNSASASRHGPSREDAAEKAVARVGKLKKRPSVSFSSISDYGFKGSLSFTIAEASKASSATDAAIRAVAPYAHNHLIEEAMEDLTRQTTDATRSLVPVKDEEGTPAEIETQK